MATDTLQPDLAGAAARNLGVSPLALARRVLSVLASLKLTCVLFALAVFLVFAGSLAQVDLDIWQVLQQYFRTALARIELKVFFPRSWNVGWAFYFPGGFAIGAAMAVNLLAAHLVRFKIAASGTRLLAGVAVLVAGGVMTWLVVASGSSADGFQGEPLVSWPTLWNLLRWSLALALVAGSIWLFKLDRTQRLQFALAAGSVAILAGVVGWLWLNPDFALSDSSLRILWQLIKGTAAGVVLLVGSWLVFARRAGIVLIHGAVALLMANELIVAGLHAEGQMRIYEHETTNFVKDIRTVELAVVDPSPADENRVVAVPKSRLEAGSKIADPALPFDIFVEKFFDNSAVRKLAAGEPNAADRGVGLEYLAVADAPVSGVDMQRQVNLAAAYVKLSRKDNGQPLGTYLLWQNFSEQDLPEKVELDGRTYDLFLRFKRTYKPYSVYLIDVQRQNYPGTEIPQHYSSDVRIVDLSRPDRPVDVEKHIWMNNPLRYAGETYYQSGYDVTEGREYTVLQVVSNTGWMLPYVCCMLAAVGMAWHFLTMLGRFLQRRQGEAARQAAAARPQASFGYWALPLAVGAVALFFATYNARPPKSLPKEMRLDDCGRLPVMDGGRIKPLDTLARNSLVALSNRDTFVDKKDERQPAIRWLLDAITHSDAAYEHRVFRIDNPELRKLLGLEARDGYKYAIKEFRDKLADFDQELSRINARGPATPDAYESAVREFNRKLNTYIGLTEAFSVPNVRPDHALEDLQAAVQQVQLRGDDAALPKAVPPLADGQKWETYAAAWTKTLVMQHAGGQQPPPALMNLAELLLAYQKNDVAKFNSRLATYEDLLADSPLAGLSGSRIAWEALLNRLRPFSNASYLYFFAFVLLLASWLGWSAPLRRSATALMLVALAVQTFALVARVYISGRPPVTNLYSTAPFIGWACVALGLALDVAFRMDVGRATGALAGFATLLIADYLALDGDTLNVLQAVLDTQFWLSTHVITINLGYAMSLLAGILGTCYILRRALDKSFTAAQAERVHRMTYGTLGFAIFFSFIGTVLGGLWADDSWGRFWGWDTKENGALMIVLWNALLLHARWGAVVRQTGFAVLAVLGNIVVAWSWYGVNQLSVGLHNYGKAEGVSLALAAFAAAQLAIAALGVWGTPRVARQSAAAAT